MSLGSRTNRTNSGGQPKYYPQGRDSMNSHGSSFKFGKDD